jgi:membrane-associated protease RseP (regulator of RpoE activity)
MYLDQRKYDEKPLSKSELAFVLIISGLFLFMMMMELFSNYEPRKLGAILFIIFWIPLLFIHELGHAIMAKWLGWEVSKVNIGIGQKVYSRKVGDAQLDIRMFPIEGFVSCAPKDQHGTRFQNALIYFAGPGVELLIFFVIMLIFGASWLFTPVDDYGVIAIQSFAFAALAGAVINLIPVGIQTKDGITPNDGLGILMSLFGKAGK